MRSSLTLTLSVAIVELVIVAAVEAGCTQTHRDATPSRSDASAADSGPITMDAAAGGDAGDAGSSSSSTDSGGIRDAAPDTAVPPLVDSAAPASDGDSAGTVPFALGQAPFTAMSTWNTPIAANATYTPLAWTTSDGNTYWVNWDSYSAPIYVASPTDPLVQVTVPAGWGWPANTSFHAPAGATGAPGTDGEIVVIDGTTVYNFWQFNRASDTTATASAYAETDAITGTGWGTPSPFLGAGIVAAGSSELAGMLVEAETEAGDIQHALQITIYSSLNAPGFTGNAIAGDGPSAGGIVQEGDRLGIPPGTPMASGLSPLGEQVFSAFQKYGAFDIDTGGATTLRAQQNAYDMATMSALQTDMAKLMPLLELVN
jgi:hypothetical protein